MVSFRKESFNMILYLTLLWTVLCISLTSTSTLSPRIINGIDARNTPWMVAILSRDTTSNYKFNLICGGSLVAPDWVLTARHCIYDSNNEQKFEVFGISIGDVRWSEGSIISVSQLHSYNANDNSDDIILLKLETRIIKISPIKVQYEDNLQYGDRQATIYGWGQTENTKTSDTLKTTNVTLYAQDKCHYESFLCFNPARTNSNFCLGDDGGPMVIEINNEPILIGIGHTFATNEGNECVDASIYTSVPFYGHWIKRNIS